MQRSSLQTATPIFFGIGLQVTIRVAIACLDRGREFPQSRVIAALVAVDLSDDRLAPLDQLGVVLRLLDHPLGVSLGLVLFLLVQLGLVLFRFVLVQLAIMKVSEMLRVRCAVRLRHVGVLSVADAAELHGASDAYRRCFEPGLSFWKGRSNAEGGRHTL